MNAKTLPPSQARSRITGLSIHSIARRAGLLCIIAMILACCLGPAFCTPSNSGIPTSGPTALVQSSGELANPMSGFYRWFGQEIAPQEEPALDEYQRFNWRTIEPQPNKFDFSAIETAAAEAHLRGHKFAFRIMSVWSGKGNELPDDMVALMPNGYWFRGDAGSENTYVPDWNSAVFLQRSQSLIAALGAKFDGDPRIAWVEIGTYGNWGEWHSGYISGPLPSGVPIATQATKQAIVDMYVSAFPTTRLLMMTDDPDALIYAMHRSPRIGLRRDSLGKAHFANDIMSNSKAWSAAVDRWKTAPFVTELYYPSINGQLDLAAEQVEQFHVALVGNGNLSSPWDQLSAADEAKFLKIGQRAGFRFSMTSFAVPPVLRRGRSFKLTSNWLNAGVAPAYDPWAVTFSLIDPATNLCVWSGVSSLNLESFLPADAPSRTRDRFVLPMSVAAGQYELNVSVNDPHGYSKPLELANAGRTAGGSYPLGVLVVK